MSDIQKHTPGPWHVHRGLDPTELEISTSDRAERMAWAVATVWGAAGDTEWRPELTANAYLIAAAPAMLIALKQIQKTCPADSDTTREFNVAWGLLEAAIAKAEPPE